MSKMLTVMKREYLTRIKSKGFIIATVAMPLFILIMVFAPVVLSLIQSDDQQKIAVIDMTNVIYPELETNLGDTTASGERLYDLLQVEVSAGELKAEEERLRAEIQNGELNGLMVIPENVFQENNVEYYAKNVSNFNQNREFRNAISSIVQEARVRERGLSPELVSELTRRVNLETFRVGKDGGEQKDAGQTFILTFVLVMFLYISLIAYGATVMQAVTEEKSSRVVELVVSSIKPFHLMAGKILGIGSVGLTQFLLWAATAAGISAYAGAIVGMFGGDQSAGLAMPQIDASILVYFVVYFILGYILFATLYAAVGAIVNSQEEAQQLQFPVIMLLIIPLILMQFVIRNPNATSSVALSHFPFFSPILMFTRIVVETPSFGEILLSFAIMIVAIAAMIYLVGKIFRVGILMYGKRPTLPEVLKWLRY
ncbi:MAG: ABC transporter permease [Deferribacteres bacterium]|nr:ABC transporter permease [Deferribacteres bacterium]